MQAEKTPLCEKFFSCGVGSRSDALRSCPLFRLKSRPFLEAPIEKLPPPCYSKMIPEKPGSSNDRSS